jgi:hypothetical protein
MNPATAGASHGRRLEITPLPERSLELVYHGPLGLQPKVGPLQSIAADFSDRVSIRCSSCELAFGDGIDGMAWLNAKPEGATVQIRWHRPLLDVEVDSRDGQPFEYLVSGPDGSLPILSGTGAPPRVFAGDTERPISIGSGGAWAFSLAESSADFSVTSPHKFRMTVDGPQDNVAFFAYPAAIHINLPDPFANAENFLASPLGQPSVVVNSVRQDLSAGDRVELVSDERHPVQVPNLDDGSITLSPPLRLDLSASKGQMGLSATGKVRDVRIDETSLTTTTLWVWIGDAFRGGIVGLALTLSVVLIQTMWNQVREHGAPRAESQGPGDGKR